MKSHFGTVSVRVDGERACFTRPECKADKVSYPILTPTAARGVLEAIYWHPEMYWKVMRIVNLKELKWFSLMVNEINGDKGVGREWASMNPFNVSDYRDQRHLLGLKNVAYAIHAEIISRDGKKECEAKHRDIFQRRVKKGQCAYQPFLGTREFTGYFRPTDNSDKPYPLPEESIGRMVGSLYDLTIDPKLRLHPIKRKTFEANVRNGILDIDPAVYDGGYNDVT